MFELELVLNNLNILLKWRFLGYTPRKSQQIREFAFPQDQVIWELVTLGLHLEKVSLCDLSLLPEIPNKGCYKAFYIPPLYPNDILPA